MIHRSKTVMPVARCSRFFRILPCGTGSVLQESFPSYLDRLSARHMVPLKPFLRKIICACWSGFDPRAHIRKLLVGHQDADSVVNFVAAETTVSTVHDSFSPFLREYASPKPDIRGTTAWCPDCLAEWRRKGLPVYRPLLWSISSVKFCPVHWAEIMTKCPVCHQHMDYIGKGHWSGKCPSCAASLARASGERTPSCQPSDFERSCTMRLSELFTSDRVPSRSHDLTIFRRNLEVALKSTGVNEFCRKTGFSMSNVKAWRKNERKPQLMSLLRLSYCLDVPLQNWTSKQLTSINACKAFVGASG